MVTVAVVMGFPKRTKISLVMKGVAFASGRRVIISFHEHLITMDPHIDICGGTHLLYHHVKVSGLSIKPRIFRHDT